MTKSKIDVDLKGVQQTLLLPLLGRAKFSKENYSPIHDERAIQLVDSLNYDFDRLSQQIGSSTLYWIARAYHFDEAIKHYLYSHPEGSIVNLGAGLETAFYRVDNGQLTWIDLDLPDVILLREKLLPPTERIHSLAKSILDYSWMDDVKQFGDEFFFFAGGFFMYFTELQVKSLFIEMANRFPKSELIFDSISIRGLSYANQMLEDSKMNHASLQWGLDDPDVLEKWSPRMKVKTKIPCFKGIKRKFKFPIGLSIKMFLQDIFDKSGIIHLKFG